MTREAGRQLPAFPMIGGGMEISLKLGGVLFRFYSERDLGFDPELSDFLAERSGPADLNIRVSWDWEHARHPHTDCVGQDLLQTFYREGETRWCGMRGGSKGAIASTCYTPDFREVVCTIHAEPFLQPPSTMGSVLRMLPMRAIFLHFGVLFLHAAQIAYRGRGILFSAPSGTGKTTQAKLWQAHRGAEIACNDRTLLRKTGGVWHTYGYPLDGSEPVRSGSVHPLGCVVLLEQGQDNAVQRLRPARAVCLLMQQTVIDGWDAHARERALELLMTLLADVPVYLLRCTPDEAAVQALETKLTEEGVLPNGSDFGPALE